MITPKIILPSDPRSASLVGPTDIWKSRTGNLFIFEDAARNDGATHLPCSVCGEPAMKPCKRCPTHEEEFEAKQYLKRETRPWNESDGVPLYSDALDKYYSYDGEWLDDMEDGDTVEKLRLLICEKIGYKKLDIEHWCDDLPEDGEFPDELVQAVEEFNAKIDGLFAHYYPSKYRPDTTGWPESGEEEIGGTSR